MKTEELKTISLLSGIDADVLSEDLKSHKLNIQSYSKGATVYNQNDTCNTLDIVLNGGLVAYSLAENGSAMTMFEFEKNSIIGANLLFDANNAYPLNIYCLTDCNLLHIDKNAVMEYLHDYNFVMQFVKSLSLNSQNMNRKISMFMQKTLRENILTYLNQQSVLQNSSAIELTMSKKELADYLGVQRPSLFREFKKLKDEGIIEVSNRTIRILK